MKNWKSVNITVCVFAMIGAALTQTATSVAKSPNPGLVGQLTNQLNITPAQATGGAGAMFGLAKGRLKPTDFSKVAAAVPGMNGFLKAAPAPESGSGLGSAASMASGGLGGIGASASSGAGGLASVAGSFHKLGLSPAMASKFAPVLENYVQKRGGSSTAALLAGAFK